MHRTLAPLAAAIALAWAGSASALTIVHTGPILDDDAGGAFAFLAPEAEAIYLDPGQRYRFTISAPSAPVAGRLIVNQFEHYEHYDADGNELFGSEFFIPEEIVLGDLDVIPTATGFRGFITVPGNGRRYTGGGEYEDYGHWAYVGLLLEQPAADIGGAYRLTITAVPEPATWTILTMGFGLAGVALRRRQSAPA